MASAAAFDSAAAPSRPTSIRNRASICASSRTTTSTWIPETTSDSDVLGYIADMDLLIDIATPRGETSLRPRVRFQDYPDRDDFERFEGFLDMLSRYEWERSIFDFDGNFSHQDLYNSDTPGGGFDPLDPDGGDPDGGAATIGQTRTSLGTAADLRARGDGADAHRHVAPTILRRDTTPMTAPQPGPTTTTASSTAICPGRSTLPATSRWARTRHATRRRTTARRPTPLAGDWVTPIAGPKRTGSKLRSSTSATTQRVACPVLLEETTSNFGGTLTAYRKLEVSEWRLSVGRTFVPTGDSGKSVVRSLPDAV